MPDEAYSIENFRNDLMGAVNAAYDKGLKIDEVLSAVDITAKIVQVHFEMIVVESTLARRNAETKLADEASGD